MSFVGCKDAGFVLIKELPIRIPLDMVGTGRRISAALGSGPAGLETLSGAPVGIALNAELNK